MRKSIIGILVGVMLLPSIAYANTYEVYAYGTGDFLATIFNGMAMHFASGDIGALVKLVLLLAFLSAMLGPLLNLINPRGADAASDGIATLIKVALLGGIATYALLIPKTNVLIIDRISPAQTQVVANVPYVNAVAASMASRIGDIIGKKSETLFSTPDALKFTNGGLALGAKYMSMFGDIYPPSHEMMDISRGSMVATSLREYLSVCVFPTFAGMSSEQNIAIAYDSLMKEYNIINYLRTSGHFNRNMCVISPMEGASSEECGAGAKVCRDVIVDIEAKWLAVQNDWLKLIENKIAQNAGQAALADAEKLQGVGALTRAVVNKYFNSTTESPETVIRNVATIKAMQDAALAYIAMTGSPSAAGYHLAATRTTPSGWGVSAKLFNAIVHTMRALFEGIIYAFSVFLPVAFVAAGLRAITVYLKMTLWLQLWVPFYVILNLFADTELTKIFKNIADKDGFVAINFITLSKAIEQSELTLGYIGSFVWAVPALAWGVVKGGEYAMTHALSAATGGGRGAQQATAEGGRVTGRLDTTVGTGYGQAFSQGGMQARVADDSHIKSAHMGKVYQEAGRSAIAHGIAQSLIKQGVPQKEAEARGMEEASRKHPQELREAGHRALEDQQAFRLGQAAGLFRGMDGSYGTYAYHQAGGVGRATSAQEKLDFFRKAFQNPNMTLGEAMTLQGLGFDAQKTADGRGILTFPGGSSAEIQSAGGVKPFQANIPAFKLNASQVQTDALATQVSETLGRTDNWKNVLSNDRFKSSQTGIGSEIVDEIGNQTAKKFAESAKKDQNFTKGHSSLTNTATGGKVEVSAGLPPGIVSARITGSNSIEYQDQKGETFKATVSDSKMEEFSKTQQEATRDVFSKYAKTEEGRRGIASLLKEAGATEAASVMESGSRQIQSSTSESIDASNLLVKNYADTAPAFKALGGSSSPAGLSAAILSINRIFSGTGTEEERRNLDSAKARTLKELTDGFAAEFQALHQAQMQKGDKIEQDVESTKRNINPTGPSGVKPAPGVNQDTQLKRPEKGGEFTKNVKDELRKGQEEMPKGSWERLVNEQEKKADPDRTPHSEP